MVEIEIGKSFLIDDNEFKVSFINIKEQRFSADPINDETLKKIKSLEIENKFMNDKILKKVNSLEVGNKFMIENQSYIITYVHNTKKRITAKKLVAGY